MIDRRITRAGSRLPVLVLAALALTGGCASTQGEKMVQSYARTCETVGEAQGRVDTTLLTLHALRSTPALELKDGFRRYKDAVAKLEEAGAEARWNAKALQGDADAHIEAWQEEVETLKDPTIKASMEDRREAVRTNFELIKLYAQDARKAYDRYLAGTKDIVRALSIDLSPAAISSLSPSIDRVLLDGKALQERLWMMAHALDNVANGVSPLGEIN